MSNDATHYDGVYVFPDGDSYCAVFDDFENLQESDAGFGPTEIDAVVALAVAIRAEPEPALGPQHWHPPQPQGE